MFRVTTPAEPQHRTGSRAVFATTGSGWYPTIVATFVALLLLANIAATKAIAFGPILTDGGAVLFPLTYVLGDILSEVYGFKATRRAILLGFAMSLVASVTFWVVMIAPPAPGFDGQDAFERILGVVPMILLASVVAYMVGEFLNAYVLVKLKERAGERRLWVRLLGSSVVGELGDTIVFCLIAAPFIGITELVDVGIYIAVGFGWKMGIEVVMLPVTYRLIAAVKRREPSYGRALAALRTGSAEDR
jgi:uncharacterized integral membrane protein (TIGR00697 family)